MSLSISAVADLVHLKIVQGATFGPIDVYFRGPDGTTPIDITGASAFAHIRKRASDAAVVVAFDVTVVDAAAGHVTMNLTAAASEAVPAVDDSTAQGSQSVWDLLLVDAAGRILQSARGPVTGYLPATHL
jgi:hypothetical protein